MLIRSQNKKELHNLDTIKMLKVVTNSQEYFVEVNSQHTIGIYSTEEKAIKVLDMICNRYAEPISQAIVSDEETFIYQNSIFQMPQDEEVEV